MMLNRSRGNITGYSQREFLTCCLDRKYKSLVHFGKTFNTYTLYIYVSVDYNTSSNSERYFTCGVCNFENLTTKM